MLPDAPPAEVPAAASPATMAAHEDSRRKWNRWQHWKYVAFGVGGFMVGLIAVAIVILLAVVLNQNQKLLDLTNQVKNNTQTTKQAVQILIDCTTPKHPCYEQGQQATRTAVQALNAAGSAQVFCGKDPANDTLEKLEACVADELARH